MRSLLCLHVVLLVLSLPSAAGATAREDLEEGQRLFDEFDYDAAVPKLTSAKDSESLPAADRARAAIALAITQLAAGETEGARGFLAEAIALDPAVVLPAEASPKVRKLFEEAKDDYLRAHPTGEPLTHVPPAPGTEATRITVEVDPRRVSAVALFQRVSPAGEFVEQPLAAEAGAYSAALPAPPAGGAVEYYLVARDAGGAVVQQLGSRAVPLSYRSSAEPVALTGQWWFWAGSGVLVAGGILAAVLLAGGGDDPGPVAGACDAPGGQGCVRVRF